MIIRRIPIPPAHPPRQRERITYPFNLLSPQQRCWLHALNREWITTLQQAFDALKRGRRVPHNVLEGWIEDPAFQDALNITLSNMTSPTRAAGIRDAIIRCVAYEPLQDVCDLSGRCC